MSEHRVIVERLHEAFNTRRLDLYRELLDEDVLLEMHGRSLRGAAAICDSVAATVRELPGVRRRLERIFADTADTVVIETQYFDASAAGAEPATWGGLRLPIAYCEVWRIAAGRIVECRIYPNIEPSEQLSGGDATRWPGVDQLVAEQAALRRVATLVAGGATQPEVFQAVVSEAGELLGENVMLMRFDGEDVTTNLAQHSADDIPDLTGISTHRGDGPPRPAHTGRPVRVDSYVGVPGPGAESSRMLGVTASAAAPIVLQGRRWGALAVFSRSALAPGIEDRLAQFAELAATALANAESRRELQLLADEQAALRRVAELVARGAPTEEVFDQVTGEASRLLGDTHTEMLRYERSGTEVVNLSQSRTPESERPDPRFGPGARTPVVGELGRARVWRTGRATRIDDYRGIAGREWISPAVRAGVLVPIVVERQLWGVLAATSPGPPLPAGTEERLTRFCELAATAIANADSRTQLTASRARIVASGDEARRRLARDVHDGAQQRLVHAIIMLRQAQSALGATTGAAADLLEESLRQAQDANEQLRELAHGIMPAALARGGLRAAIDSLRGHVPITLNAEVTPDRLPERVELTAYFVITEALTNVIKHAGAGRARVRAVLEAGRLRVEVSDDGRGGADPECGTGLVGLADRVDAAGGTLSLTSPPGAGTTVSIELPINQHRARDRP